MRDFFVPRDMLLCGSQAAMPTDFSVRGFPAGQGEANAFLSGIFGSATQPWTPAEITTALWWDASSESTSVSSLHDRSGHNRHATQGSSANQPAKNGNYLTFDGSDDFMAAPAFTILQKTSLFIVCRTHTLAGTRTVINQQYGDVLSPWQLYFEADGRVRDWRAGAQGHGVSANTWFQIAEIQSATNVADMWKDGTPGTRGTTSTGYPSSTSIHLGRAQAWGSLGWFDGDFCEAVLVLSDIDEATRLKIEGYLAHKWDALLGVTTLVSALPPGHPYKSAAPTI